MLSIIYRKKNIQYFSEILMEITNIHTNYKDYAAKCSNYFLLV